MLPEQFIYLGSALNFLGIAAYVRATLQGQTQPNRVTWLLWTIAPLITWAAQMSQGVGVQAWWTFTVGAGPFLVFLATFVNKKAVWNLGKLDYICGVLSIIGIAAWYMTQIGNVAICFSILADLLAAVPTIIKSYRAPETENDTNFLLSSLNAMVILLTIKNWYFATYAFPLYFFVLNFPLFLLIRFKLGKRLFR